MRRLIATAALVAAALTVPALAASAATHVPFAVQDVNGVLVTRQPLSVGQVIYSGGISHTVEFARCSYGTCTVTLAPGLPVSDWGKTVLFST